MLKYLILFLVSSVFSFLLTPLVRSVAGRLGAFDLPDERKIHDKPIPRWGGISIFVAFNLGIFLATQFEFFYLPISFLKEIRYNFLFAGSILVIGLGAIDDIRNVPVSVKFFFQIVAGLLAVLAFPKIEAISLPFATIHLGSWSIPITVLWVVGITNAINLLDGLDGLAGGASFIAAISLFSIFFLQQNIGFAIICLIFAGSILGFLKYNFHPASIFLGDSGAYYLGFMLSVLSIVGGHRGPTTVAILIPILALGLPIFDTLLSMTRRLLKSLHIMEVDEESNRIKLFFIDGWSMFRADKGHIHHRLLQLGFTQRKAVILLYAVSIILGGLALSSVYFKNINHALLVTAIVIAAYVGVSKLGYSEMKILSNGALLPLFNTPVVNRRILRVFADMTIISLSYYFAFLLRFEGDFTPAKNYYLATFPLILLSKIIIFYFSGLYSGAWRYTSVGDLMKMLKAVVLGCIVSALLLWIIPGLGIISRAALLIDFNLLVLLVVGSRSSFRILDHLHMSKNHKGRKVLIYGAGKRGVYALREFISNPHSDLSPVGFIDDSPRFQGKQIDGFPVLGTLDSFDSILQKNSISEVILCREDLPKEKLRRLVEICNSYHIPLSNYKTRLEEILPAKDSKEAGE
jgi:UDP-GlcNAc:undecaprenyl-phosphate GlcNAc-1-phosphate transferase